MYTLLIDVYVKKWDIQLNSEIKFFSKGMDFCLAHKIFIKIYVTNRHKRFLTAQKITAVGDPKKGNPKNCVTNWWFSWK